jgi:hypothetical protein
MTIYMLVFSALTAWAPKADVRVVQELAEAISDAGVGSTTALEMAALAVLESGLQPWVLDGRCNDRNWRESVRGHEVMRLYKATCDGGVAVGAWQWHPRAGGPTKSDMLDLRTAALVVARTWPVNRRAWTPWRVAVRMAGQWAREPAGVAGTEPAGAVEEAKE